MIGELAEILIRVLGGVWVVKEKINFLKEGSLQKKIMFLLYEICLKNMGGYVGLSAKIISPPCLPHGLKGVFVSGGATIGYGCVIFQNVTIGSNSIPTSKTCGSPTVGNNCYIGVGAVIVGDITVGNNCRIGANCTVFFDIPDNSVVLSSKPRVMQKENNINLYYKWSEKGPVYWDKGVWVLEKDQKICELFTGKL